MIQPATDPWSVSGDLDDFIAAPLDDDLLDAPPVPVPDASRANIALRRLMRLNDNADQITTWAQDEHDRIDAWMNDRLDRINRERSWLRLSLEAFMRQHADATRERSLSLPNGMLKLSKPRERTVITDPDALLAWAKDNEPSLVHIVESVQATSVKTRCETGTPVSADGNDGQPVWQIPFVWDVSGEVIPGVHAEVNDRDTFNVKVGG